jgi:hypothetical protein
VVVEDALVDGVVEAICVEVVAVAFLFAGVIVDGVAVDEVFDEGVLVGC